MGMITFRRYRMRQAAEAEARGDTELALAHTGAAEDPERATTPLPEDFPGRELLEGARPTPYRYYEDLYGADRAELQEIDGIGPSTADKIIAAYEAWDAEQA